ncbi:MAG: MBL fold metallo-hydrolase [Lachnospiraceae bacterium]|nr:MBL fold metallo-hydrolase [Lachnospiraceae bacterium]
MEEWFTVEQIDNDTYAISEYKHWEEPHAYLVCGSKSAVLIDTGLGVADIGCVVRQLTELPVTVVTTHVHWDHIGGHEHFDNKAVFHEEKDWLSGKFPLPLAVVKSNLLREPCEFPKDFDIENYGVYQGEPLRILHDGERIHLGNRELVVIHTPGHSPGHICLYEPARKYLYSGDLIYKGCLDAFYPTTDPKLFYDSVKKVCRLEVKRILPGHHDLNILPDFVGKIKDGFQMLEDKGLLVQGSGKFDFKEFQIHI